jgi:hypothetical protein
MELVVKVEYLRVDLIVFQCAHLQGLSIKVIKLQKNEYFRIDASRRITG